MCEASMHVPHRTANKVERLVVKPLPPHPHMSGLYPARGDQSKLVCIRKETLATIKVVQFSARPGVLATAVLRLSKKRNVRVRLLREGYQDLVLFQIGRSCYRVSMSQLERGTRIDIGVPVRRRKAKPVIKTDAGMKAIARALDEATKTEVAVKKPN